MRHGPAIALVWIIGTLVSWGFNAHLTCRDARPDHALTCTTIMSAGWPVFAPATFTAWWFR